MPSPLLRSTVDLGSAADTQHEVEVAVHLDVRRPDAEGLAPQDAGSSRWPRSRRRTCRPPSAGRPSNRRRRRRRSPSGSRSSSRRPGLRAARVATPGPPGNGSTVPVAVDRAAPSRPSATKRTGGPSPVERHGHERVRTARTGLVRSARPRRRSRLVGRRGRGRRRCEPQERLDRLADRASGVSTAARSLRKAGVCTSTLRRKTTRVAAERGWTWPPARARGRLCLGLRAARTARAARVARPNHRAPPRRRA